MSNFEGRRQRSRSPVMPLARQTSPAYLITNLDSHNNKSVLPALEREIAFSLPPTTQMIAGGGKRETKFAVDLHDISLAERNQLRVMGPVATSRVKPGDLASIVVGGTTTTSNTGPDPIPANALVGIDLPVNTAQTNLPPEWKNGMFTHDAKPKLRAMTVVVPDDQSEAYRGRGRLLGVSLHYSEPGESLDLMIAK